LTVCVLGVNGPFSSLKSPPVTALAAVLVVSVSSEISAHPTSATNAKAAMQ
jgi:hypothetical protein